MSKYKNIQTKKEYNKLLKSGMFWEFHPELTGDWEKDNPKLKLGCSKFYGKWLK